MEASDPDTHHLELYSGQEDDYWWLDIGDLIHPHIFRHPERYPVVFARLQLLLDLAAAAKAVEDRLLWELADPS